MDLAKYLHLLKIIKQCDVFAPQHIGKNDILIGGGKIIAYENEISPGSKFTSNVEYINAPWAIIFISSPVIGTL